MGGKDIVWPCFSVLSNVIFKYSFSFLQWLKIAIRKGVSGDGFTFAGYYNLG